MERLCRAPSAAMLRHTLLRPPNSGIGKLAQQFLEHADTPDDLPVARPSQGLRTPLNTLIVLQESQPGPKCRPSSAVNLQRNFLRRTYTIISMLLLTVHRILPVADVLQPVYAPCLGFKEQSTYIFRSPPHPLNSVWFGIP